MSNENGVPNCTLVIGDSGDIGQAIVAKMIDRGDIVVGVSRSKIDKNPLQSNNYIRVNFDLVGESSIQSLFEKQLCKWKFNHMVYAAGFHKIKPLTTLSNGALDEHYLLNVQAMIDCCRFFSSAKYSNRNFPRSITLISSVAHRIAEPGLVAYSATKAAMVAAARSMAVEFSNKKVRVNTISPGWIESRKSKDISATMSPETLNAIQRQYPLGLGKPEDVASAAVFLSDSKSARWITGTDLVIDGGRSCL
jgi:NAD(P)-dependent dehydrogenase (short-subunit alcohol dehydrogenase family)